MKDSFNKGDDRAGQRRPPVLEVGGLTVRFGDHQALERVAFTVPEGAFVAIVGPNGGGKSTLIKAVLGLVEPAQGHLRVLGRRPREVPPGWIGYVPQVKTLDRTFPALAFELVVSGLRRRWPMRVSRAERTAALEALARVGAAHLVERPLARLSGGELQRVYLARALVRRPELVLLDEPATGIDAVGEQDLYRLLEAYQRETRATILMVTHDWEAARHHASHVLVLNRRLIGFGPPERALSEECLRRAFGHVGHAHRMAFNAGGTDA
ncbi:metal ABC transporter ATP-binding protein [Marinithermus hydrothermalis]|uniref:Phosphonate-transporting ATPase n=1 Tax=Marinithermus hydrothermalis (strain DSM 14884 / JCM 11576 / T1) TaxID=869210 RepID=F2NMF9_MARHT|nr:ABC transporter ATP-binding protein [Marinithermus hydrothermalis]AEB12129.1 Phosphonate-transporting ATPase [Marinithermus hydrothermalis DSM 14884]